MQKAVWIGLGIVVLLLAAGMVTWFVLGTSDEDEIAPDFSVLSIDNETIERSDFDDDTLMIYFFGDTCTQCIARWPDVDTVYQQHQPDGLEVVAVAVWGATPDEVRVHAEDHNLSDDPNFRWATPEGNVLSEYDVRATPTYVLLDEGKEVWRGHGNFDIEEMSDEIAAALA